VINWANQVSRDRHIRPPRTASGQFAPCPESSKNECALAPPTGNSSDYRGKFIYKYDFLTRPVDPLVVAIVLDPRHGDRPVSCDAQLVSVRRKGCPQATRDHATGALVMTATEAAAFLNAAPAWMLPLQLHADHRRRGLDRRFQARNAVSAVKTGRTPHSDLTDVRLRRLGAAQRGVSPA
jgi:hypothetical protein